ncbi:unnamed protein product, partial [Closterium sp. NIES-53]
TCTQRSTLAALGFAPSTADPSLFLRTDTSLPPFYVLVYVDDLVFATADNAGLAHVKSELQKRHTCTDLGELRSYLGLQITRDRAQRTITLTQSHMVQQVLQRFDFTYSSPQATPLSTRHSLSALPSDESVEPSGPYPELVGCLMYLMSYTRPDLAYPLSILARYVAPGRHGPEHMAAAKRVLRYLCSTSGMGLVLGGRRPVVLTGHADASWADDQATQRSSQGYTFSLGSGSVSWRSTRSSSVLSSSSEAEIYAGAMAAQELRWLTYPLTDLGEQPRSPPVLYVDNKAMLALCREHRLEHRMKHIALCYFLARELQQRGQLRLAYVASEANTADIFTKALAPGDHQCFCTLLASRFYRRLNNLHREHFGPHAITPHWPLHLGQRTAALVESLLPDLGPFPAVRVETCLSSLGACVVSSPGASNGLCVGAAATTSLARAFVAGSGATSQTAPLSFTLDSGASTCFFRDHTDLTPLRTPVTAALADPSVGPVVASSTNTLPCPAAPSGFLTGTCPDHLSFECPDRSDPDDDDTKGGQGRSAGRCPHWESKLRKEKQSTKSLTSTKEADSSSSGKGRGDQEASSSLVGVVEPIVSLAPEASEDFQAVAAAVQTNPVVILLNSGCSHHLMGTKDAFVDLEPSDDVNHMRDFNGALQDIRGRDTVALRGEAGKQLLIHDVLYVPGVQANLLSTGQLKQNGVKPQEDRDGVLLVSATGDVLGREKYTGRVLCTDPRPCSAKSTTPTTKAVALRAIVSATKSTPARWHARLARVGVDTIMSLAKHEVVTGLDIKLSVGTDSPCVSCVGGKLARHTFPDKGSDADASLAVVHIDPCGPFQVAAKDGSL